MTCSTDGCARAITNAKWALCGRCYKRKYRRGEIPPRPDRSGECSEPGCTEPARGGGCGLCSMHYTRALRHGSPDQVLIDGPLPSGLKTYLAGFDRLLFARSDQEISDAVAVMSEHAPGAVGSRPEHVHDPLPDELLPNLEAYATFRRAPTHKEAPTHAH